MGNTQDTQTYQVFVEGFVYRRIEELHAQGLDVEEIHEAMVRPGTSWPMAVGRVRFFLADIERREAEAKGGKGK